VEAESPRLVEVPRSQREYDRDQDAKIEESGPEQVIIVAKDGSRKPPGGDERIDGLETRQLGQLQRKVEEGGRTVYTQMRTMPINTATNTQTVQTFVRSPLNRFAAVAAATTITVENS
jgi:hypothetical protein